jgi:hypothetical protein
LSVAALLAARFIVHDKLELQSFLDSFELVAPKQPPINRRINPRRVCHRLLWSGRAFLGLKQETLLFQFLPLKRNKRIFYFSHERRIAKSRIHHPIGAVD